MTWADAATGLYRTSLSSSQDGGTSWTEPVFVTDESDEEEKSPVVVSDGEQTVWMAYSTRDDALLVSSLDGGLTFEAPVSLTSPEGPLEYPELAYGGGYLFAVGTSTGSGVWLLRY
jgi:hypothetical protein